MRKSGTKEGIEGSIGFKHGIDVNPSSVSTQTGGTRSDLMIRVCSCTRRSSSLHNPNTRSIMMTCKSCGGQSTVDRGGPSCSSNLNTSDLELPRPIDPEVRWKTVNRRQRAARRAKTFSGGDRLKDEIISFYACGNPTSLEVAQEEASASESEKLGVSILGRRFGDPMENVPIKKRRVHMDCSPSPPSTPLLVDPYEKIPSRSGGGISSYGKHRKVKTLGGKHMEEKRGPLEAADFSGISILAAAACESEMDVAKLNGECSKSARSLDERKQEIISGSSLLDPLHGIKGDKLNIRDRALKLSEIAPDMKPLFPTTLNSSESAPDMKPLFPTTLNGPENLVGSAAALEGNTALYSLLSNANKTDIFSSVSDAKSSDVTMSTNSSSPGKSVGCFGDTVVHTKHSNAAHDSRLHWDLNIAMEAWDAHCGDDDNHDMVGPDPVASVSDCNDAQKEMNKSQVCRDLSQATVAEVILRHSVDKIHVADAAKDGNAKGESDIPGDGSFHPLCSRSPPKVQLLESECLNGDDSSAKTNNLLDLQKSSYVSNVSLHIGSNPDLSSLSLTKEHFAFAANVEKLDVSHTSPLDCEGLSHLTSEDAHAGGSSIQTSVLGSRVKPMTSRLVSEESTNIATVSSKSFTDAGWSDDKLGQASLQSISEFKNHELLDVDSGTSKIDQSVNDKAEHDTDVLCVDKKAADADNDSDLPDSHPEDNLRTSDCVMSYAHIEGGVDATIDYRNRLLACVNATSAETCYITSDIHAHGLNSECTKQADTDMDNIVDSKSRAQSQPSGYKHDLQKVTSNNCLEHRYQTDTSRFSKDLSVTGKVDVEEDDSQYEDGELRESGDRYWADDIYEEVKCASYQVSDYKDEKAAPDIHHVPVGSVPNNMVMPVANYNGTLSRKEDCDVSPISSKRSWSSNCLDGGSGMMCAASARSIHVNMKNESRMYDNLDLTIARSAGTVSQSERGGDGLGEDPLNIRSKPVGWDMLPDQRHSREDSRDRVDSSNLCVLGTLEAAEACESFRPMGLPNRDIQSRLDRLRSFDRPHRNEHCRSDDGYGSGSKTERSVDRPHGRAGASRHIQANIRGEQWAENSNSSRSTQRRSPDYNNYGPAGPRNAAEAAVAKMESSGFVVAADGTLVRAVDAANTSTMSRRMRNKSSFYHPLSRRCSPVDRDGSRGLSREPAHAREAPPERCFGASGNRSGRYGSQMDKDHAIDENLSSVHSSLSNRQRRFPAHRASLDLSRAHSRSPSGSRSRSPHAWTSNGGSSIRRHSRSPNYMTGVRIGRMTSPQRQHRFNDRVMRGSPSRNSTYSQHDSTWVEGRSCSTLDISYHKKRYSRRSPPLRITSRNDMFDLMDSQGRSRSREFHRPTRDFKRGNKHDGNGDDKRCNDRYGTVKPYEHNGAVKQFRNHAGDKPHPHTSAPRSPEPQRGSPQRF
ncbi:hypothetical protein CFC21_103032 [Triticum aestivum]|uniref:Uncharacterized protein n=3 Tax=Triticum TaxID=4564 RepID=A0A9R1A380_TRITD|nr:uncharacterized protein LOC123157451 [Triticum aestivum]KAF7101799.1 hypothetical protein CFC21_103032 [Triticum aestivum]VAI87488.1 unnamed protein product [Triticum turgidum subsp. durum]